GARASRPLFVTPPTRVARRVSFTTKARRHEVFTKRFLGAKRPLFLRASFVSSCLRGEADSPRFIPFEMQQRAGGTPALPDCVVDSLGPPASCRLFLKEPAGSGAPRN